MQYGLRIAELLLLKARISFYKKYLHNGEKSGELESLNAAKLRIEEIGQWGLLPEWERVQNELEQIPLFMHEFKKKQKEENTMTGHFTEGYALIIGIANYAHPKIQNLGKTVLKDAEDVRNLLISEEQCVYLEANTRILLDEQATAGNIRKELQWLAASAGEESTAVIFFSGHGGRIEKGEDAGNYLIPQDCDLSDIGGTAISDQEFTKLLRLVKAERVLVLFDSCHSGGVGELKDFIIEGNELKSGFDEQYYEQLAQGTGRVIMSSSRSDELSRILSGMDNSLFTHYLLEALRGNGYHRGDGRIRVFDVFDYVSENVPEIAQKRPIKVDVDEYDDSQHPVLKTHIENNFPISLFLGGTKTGIQKPPPPPPMPYKPTQSYILDMLYEAYRHEPDEWVPSEQIRKQLNISQEQLNDFILSLKEKGFIKSEHLGQKALLKITTKGVEIMK